MRTRSGCGMPPSRVSAWPGGSPSVQTPSSSARRTSAWCDSRTRSLRWWSNVGYRKKRSWSSAKCLPASRMPPLRSVTSCSPSASARTVTANSLKAIGIGRVGLVEGESGIRATWGTRAQTHRRRTYSTAPADPRVGHRHILNTKKRIRQIALHLTGFSATGMVSTAVRRRVRKRSIGALAGEALDDLDHGREVLLAEPAANAGAVELAREAGEGERCARTARLLQAQDDILEHVLELEEHGNVMVDHRAPLELAHGRVRRPTGHDLQQRFEVQADPPADRDRLRERGAVDRRHALREHL